MISLTVRSGHRHVVRRCGRGYITAVAFSPPLLIRPVALVAPLRVTAMLRMCYRLVMAWQRAAIAFSRRAISFSRHALHRTNAWVSPCAVLTPFPFSYRNLLERFLSVYYKH